MRNEEGSTLVALLAVMMVVMAVGVASVQTAQHSNDVTSIDREKLQTIEAAEAGISEAIRRLEASEAGPQLDPCNAPIDAARTNLYDGSRVVGQYQVDINNTADSNVCLIHSWGFAPTGRTSAGPGTRSMRHLEVAVRMVPNRGFPYTIFAEGGLGTLEVWNTGTLQGDAYAEALSDNSQRNKLNAQNFISPGSLTTQNNAVFQGAIWVGGNLVLGSGSTVAQSVTATGTAPNTAGNISLGGGAVVGTDARAKGSITLANGAVVQGTVAPNSTNLNPPPTLVKPVFDQSALTFPPTPCNPGSTVGCEGTVAEVNTAINRNKANLKGVYHATGAGTVSIPTSNVTGDLTVVSDGKVSMTNSALLGTGTQRVAIVAKSTANDAISASQLSALNVHTLLYAFGGIDIKNGVEMTGAIYANEIVLKNSYSLFKSQVLVDNPPDGFTFDYSSASSFTAIPTLWREVVPGPPPS